MIVNEQTMHSFIRKCFSGASTPLAKGKKALEPIDFPFTPEELKLQQNKRSNLARFVKPEQGAVIGVVGSKAQVERELHKKLTRVNYPEVFTKRFRAKQLDISYEHLPLKDRTNLLEGVITFLDRDLMEVRDENSTSRKDFIRKMHDER